MRFALDKPVKITMLGAGGTGGHVAPHLYRLLHTLERPVKIVIADGDIVEQKNLVRQNFISADLGRNKAQVLAERYASAFGMEAYYIPDFIESESRLAELVEPDRYHTGTYSRVYEEGHSILIGAVDNNKSRRLCHEVFTKSDDLIYLDSGNGEFTGQVVCGIRRSGQTYYKPIGDVYPDVLEDTDKFPTELSCAEASVSAPQSIVANIMAATAVISYLYNILILGSIDVMRKLTANVLSGVIGTTIQGYQIENARTKCGPYFASDRYGFLLGCNPHDGYITWQFNYDEDGNISTYWGRYFAERDDALQDYETRDQGSQTFEPVLTVVETKAATNEDSPVAERDIEAAIWDFERLQSHVGHKVEVVTYGDNRNVSVECMDCCEVLYSLDNPVDWGDEDGA